MMRNELKNLEASYSKDGELGLIKDMAGSLWSAGFTAELVLGRSKKQRIVNLDGVFNTKTSLNIIFSKEGCPYTFVVIKGNKHLQGCLIDIDALKVASNRRLGMTKSKKGDIDFRPYFDDDCGIRHKLHNAYMGVADKEFQIDHITRRGAICIKEQLRVCTSEQNSRNKKVSENNINLQKRTFKLSSIMLPDKEDVDALRAAGYTLTNVKKVDFNKNEYETCKYNLSSPRFGSVEELYQAINEVENKFYDEFRYNPIYAFDDIEMCGGIEYSGLIWTYLYMQVKLLGLNEDEFVELRKEFLKKYCPDMCDYYGIA